MAVQTKIVRKDAQEKVSGQARYAADMLPQGTLHAHLLTSPAAHGLIRRIDVTAAENAPGVLAVITGSDQQKLCGPLLQDRPPLAIGRVRYAGEPLAAVIARTEAQAETAARLIRCEIQPLPLIGSIEQALAPGAELLHPDAGSYASLVDDVKPVQASNIAAEFHIRKGDPAGEWSRCAQIVQQHFSLPRSAHAAMETHAVQAEYRADGTLWLLSSTQAPYTVRELVAGCLGLEPGKVRVETALVGGGFGGKSAVQTEFIAALAAMRLPQQRIILALTREQEMETAPCRLALEADIRLGADAEGRLLAAEMTYRLDCGAYSDIAPNISKAIAVDCSGPYRIDHLSCDSITVYTNHTYATAYRGFGHLEYTFCLERTMDMLADRLEMDPLQLRAINAIRPGDTTPTQVEITRSNAGNISECISRLRTISAWDEGLRQSLPNGKIHAKGMACLWKTSDPASDASAAAVLTFNPDGSCNLNTGVVEMGNGGKTQLCRMVAERLRMPYDRVHVEFGVDTRTTPEYFKTVASLSSYLAGKAALNAADDAVRQLKKLAALVLRCETDELDYGEERVFLLSNPRFCVGYQDLCGGVSLPDGNSVGQSVIGRGSAVLRHQGMLSEDSGKGRTGHGWTVGAQYAEIEYDPRDKTYRLLNAGSVTDIGAVTDADAQRGMIMGGMAMGLSMARSEACVYNSDCRMENTSLRTYKLMHIGEEPRYQAEFVTTPQLDAPQGARSYTEHGIIGMPAALANALSRAIGKPVNVLPLTGEAVWRAESGGV